MCTCSTLVEVAEDLSGDGLEVIRIDRPMLRRADVVVLAQVSMEPVVEPVAALLTGLATPVLTSPCSAVEAVALVHISSLLQGPS